MAVDVAQQQRVVEQRHAARGFPYGVEGGLDASALAGFTGLAQEQERHGKHEVDHGVDAPGDVVLDDDLARGGVDHAIVRPRIPRAAKARGQARRLG